MTASDSDVARVASPRGVVAALPSMRAQPLHAGSVGPGLDLCQGVPAPLWVPHRQGMSCVCLLFDPAAIAAAACMPIRAASAHSQAPFSHFDVLLDHFTAIHAEMKWFQVGLVLATCCQSSLLPSTCSQHPDASGQQFLFASVIASGWPCGLHCLRYLQALAEQLGVELEGQQPAQVCQDYIQFMQVGRAAVAPRWCCSLRLLVPALTSHGPAGGSAAALPRAPGGLLLYRAMLQ